MNRRAQFLVILLALFSMAQVFGLPHVRRGHIKVLDFSADPHDWAQFNYNVLHSGSNTDETSLSRDNVSTLQMIFQTQLPAVSDGAPVLWAANSNRRLDHYLFMTATDGSLMALNGAGDFRWRTTAPDGPRWTTSSPALDPSRKFVYSYALDGRVHKYAITTGAEVVDGAWPVLVTRKPDVEKGSAALSVATAADGTSYLYATVAGYPDPGDAGDYQGHVVAIRLTDGRSTTFNALCSHKPFILGYGDCGALRAGIWGRPGVIYNEGDDSVYIVTSNGAFTASTGGSNWGDSIIRLRPDLHLIRGKPIDSYTPEEFKDLDTQDLDLGSSTVALLPRPGESVPTLGVHAGKDSTIRLVDLNDLSGQGGPGHVGGELQSLKLPQKGFHLAAAAVWTGDDGHSWVYFANHRGIAAFELIGDASNPQLVERWTSSASGDSSPAVAGGVVFTVRTNRITALDAQTGAELWSDTRVGRIHWESPIVVNGAVYVADFDGRITAYALPKEIVFLP
jgi:outer membrane protein assembly factor BamB